jgi:hypothetical protein
MRAILLPRASAVGGGSVADVPEQEDRGTPAQAGATIDGFLGD